MNSKYITFLLHVLKGNYIFLPAIIIITMLVIVRKLDAYILNVRTKKEKLQ